VCGGRERLKGLAGVELDPRIAVEQPDVVMTKPGPSIFFGTRCTAILARRWCGRRECLSGDL
jgi:hypothetical protein